jgi:hypothetical protein
MISDRDIYRSAQVLVNRYGEDAGVEAAERLDAMLEAGDHWHRRSCIGHQDHRPDINRRGCASNGEGGHCTIGLHTADCLNRDQGDEHMRS